jgi:hypothetical protein
MGRVGRVGGAAALAVLVGGAVVGCEPDPPGEVVANPGIFTGVAGPGSFYQYLDADGVPTERSWFDAGNPMCANGIDDDADGRFDADDPECLADTDANERLAGHQPYSGSQLAATIEADGRLTIDPADLHVEPVEKCLMNGPELWCLNIIPQGTGPVREGIVTPELDAIAIPMTIRFELISGYPGYDPACEVGYTENVYVADDYDETTGRLTMRTIPWNPAPAMTNCGDWTGLFNTVLGLPGTGHSELIVTLTDATGAHPRFVD